MAQLPVHVLVGGLDHGVTALAHRLALDLGAPLLRAAGPAELAAAPVPAAVHLHFTDRLFGADPAAAAACAERFGASGRMSVTLHDLPQPSDGRGYAARARAYRRVAAAARLVVLSSDHELQLAFEAGVLRRAPRAGDPAAAVIPLPLQTAAAPAAAPDAPDAPDAPGPEGGPPTIGLFGFAYPGKGYEEVIDAAGAVDAALAVRVLGRAAHGHEDAIAALRQRAAAAGVGFEQRGYIPAERVVAELRQVHVPVVFHQHFSASGSLNSWIAAGRRPLVIDTRYTREMARLRPGTVTLVAPDALPDALAAALREPASTWLAPEGRADPVDAVGAYARALAGLPEPAVPTSVVIPFYDPQPAEDTPHRRRLQDVLAALRADDPSAEVIVVDDGSPRPLACEGVRVLHQEDRGFRAGAARNLGAGAARGDVIVFLDADTVPQPGFIAALTAPVRAGAAEVAVGSRLHPHGRAWAPVGWLADGYTATEDLRAADEASYRFVISALVALPRSLALLAPFDETLVGYGGEDWEAAHRWWQAGARLLHVPGAVAHHAEPDWAGRGGRGDAAALAQKNRETRALAARIPARWARPRGVGFAVPELAVVVRADAPADALIDWTARLLAVLPDAQVRLPAGCAAAFFAADPRVSTAAGAAGWRYRLEVERLFGEPEAVADVMRTLDTAAEAGECGGRWRRAGFTVHGRPAAVLVSARARALEEAAGIGGPLGAEGARGLAVAVAPAEERMDLERAWAGW